MVLFPNCKINLGLRVAGKRADGYHDIETIFYPVPLRDAAEITICSGKKEQPAFELIVTGTNIPGDVSSNLCTKAWELVKKDYPLIPPVRMHLHKAIPVGGGLGGGSADGAFTLILLNEELKLNLTTEKLLSYALQLGSDCPFFIMNKPCYATGRGEIMEEISVALKDYYFVIVNPGIHISTAEVFKEIIITAKERPSLIQLISLPIVEWRYHVVNKFEEPVFKNHPVLKQIKDELYDEGAVFASMTGTGSSLYGIFHNSKKIANLLAGGKSTVYILNQSL
ncbi:MAG TPA: 4-(cytidine 5'-diphospho)-2-C-methyl-D-erythritol kinase [Flavitalea sp.]|nr:4-(cytidine 5'-diphospho)-2-C-methyl-D-erythritol kinase [Flavitalea sp.]